MTEQELREKIVKIALNTSWTDMFGDHYSIGESAANAIADALIAAGIGDVKEAEHRVDVFELALDNMVEFVYENSIERETMKREFIKQAEKELAEENGGKKKV